MGAVDQAFGPVAPGEAEKRSTSQAAWGRWLLAIAAALATAVAIAGLAWGYVTTAAVLTVTVDGMAATVRTHQATVGDLLEELELTLQPEDRLSPSADTQLRDGLVVSVQRARPFVLESHTAVPDAGPIASQPRELRTHARSLGEALAEMGLTVGPWDELTVNGEPATRDTPLPAVSLRAAPRPAGLPLLYPWHQTEPKPVRAQVRWAVPLIVEDGGPPLELWTTATTLGEALAREGLFFYQADLVQPGLGTPVSPGLRVHVERSQPVHIRTMAHTIHTRTRVETVAELLREQGLLVTGADRVEPSMDSPLAEDTTVSIVRVQHAFEIEEDVTPYISVWEPDPEMEIDQRRLDQEGVKGITRRRYRVMLEDGQPVTRTLEDTWLAQEPITRVLKYGTDIVLRELETPQGPLTYWRKVRVFVTSYSASESGVPREAAYYGRTRLGTPVRHGVVAVDPAIIRLGSQIYVPGYGLASAEDTGGAIRGRWIDLAYEDGRLVPWSRCVDVYLLDPAPPSYQIQYRLPNSPQVNCLQR